MNACLQTVYTKVGNRLVSVDNLLSAHAEQCSVRLAESAKKKKKKRAYSY